MDSVKPRDWRKAKPGTHTREVTTQELPVEFQTLIITTAEDLASANMRIIDLERRLADAESLLKEIGSLRFKDGAFNEQFARSA